jgi:hypothetical protein
MANICHMTVFKVDSGGWRGPRPDETLSGRSWTAFVAKVLMSPSARDCDDLRIADADPIGLDPLLSTVWAMNSANDTNGLVQLLTQVTPRADIAFRPHECAAAIRDLGVLAGSVKRLGVEPVVAVPELDRVLSTLGARTGMMPRNTLPHYTVRNPSDTDSGCTPANTWNAC